MLKRVQIEMLEERIRELEGETQRLMIENEVLNGRINNTLEYMWKLPMGEIFREEKYYLHILCILQGEEE